MLSVEIRFVKQGREVSVDSFVEAIVREVRASVHEEMSQTFPKHEQQGSVSLGRVDPAMPRQAVSIREAARLLSIGGAIKSLSKSKEDEPQLVCLGNSICLWSNMSCILAAECAQCSAQQPKRRITYCRETSSKDCSLIEG